jgi:DNA-binding response OmpR family regulator
MNERVARVLIVEDDRDIREFIDLALRGEGYETALSADGWEGLRLLYTWNPDLVILDLMMPVMDGWQFRAEQLRAGLAGMPVVVLTASHEVRASLEALGVSEVLPKPFELMHLLAVVDRLVGPRTRSRSSAPDCGKVSASALA